MTAPESPLPEAASEPADLTSIVIPTLGRASLMCVIEALAAQRDPGPFEVVVVVDGGPAADLTGIPAHPECVRLESIGLPERLGVSVARNRGVSLARGRRLGFLDDDTVPAPDWIATVRRILDSGHVAAAVGRIHETDPGSLGRLRALAYDQRHAANLSPQAVARIAAGYGLDGACPCHLVDYLSGGNCCVAAEAFTACGGFDPAYLVGQDRELGRRLMRAGHHVTYAPELAIDHRTCSTVRGMISGRYRSGRSAGRADGSRPPAAIEQRRPSSQSGLRATYGAPLRGIVGAVGMRAGLLAVLSTLAYRLGLNSAPNPRRNP